MQFNPFSEIHEREGSYLGHTGKHPIFDGNCDGNKKKCNSIRIGKNQLTDFVQSFKGEDHIVK